MRTYRPIVATVVFLLATACFGDITVPPGFVVDQLAPRLDDATPRLTAITNPAYGSGVIAATAHNGVVTIRRMSLGNAEVLAVISESDLGGVRDVRFDTTGLFGNLLHVAVAVPTDYSTRLFTVMPDGTFDRKWTHGSPLNQRAITFDFTDGSNGYTPGAYLEDGNCIDGTALAHMDTSYTVTTLSP